MVVLKSYHAEPNSANHWVGKFWKVWHIFKVSEAWLITHWYYWRKDIQTFCFCLLASKRSASYLLKVVKIDLQLFWNIWEQMFVCDNLVKVGSFMAANAFILLLSHSNFYLSTLCTLVFSCGLVTIRSIDLYVLHKVPPFS